MLRHQLLEFFILPLQLLYPLVVVVHGRAEHFLGALLPDYELVEVLF